MHFKLNIHIHFKTKNIFHIKFFIINFGEKYESDPQKYETVDHFPHNSAENKKLHVFMKIKYYSFIQLMACFSSSFLAGSYSKIGGGRS
jgi:hypothetical protein